MCLQIKIKKPQIVKKNIVVFVVRKIHILTFDILSPIFSYRENSIWILNKVNTTTDMNDNFQAGFHSFKYLKDANNFKSECIEALDGLTYYVFKAIIPANAKVISGIVERCSIKTDGRPGYVSNQLKLVEKS